MVYGLWLIIISFFQMPWKIWKGTRAQLELLAEKDNFDLEATSSPCLTWVAFAGKASISVINVIIMVVAIVSGVLNLFGGFFGSVGFFTGIFRIIWYPILGYLVVVMVTWVLGYWNELLMLAINVANDLRSLRVHTVPDETPIKSSLD